MEQVYGVKYCFLVFGGRVPVRPSFTVSVLKETSKDCGSGFWNGGITGTDHP